jgi:expansin (peptidoglycan-binding protein)
MTGPSEGGRCGFPGCPEPTPEGWPHWYSGYEGDTIVRLPAQETAQITIFHPFQPAEVGGSLSASGKGAVGETQDGRGSPRTVWHGDNESTAAPNLADIPLAALPAVYRRREL